MNKPKPVKSRTNTPEQKQQADNRSAEQCLLDCLIEPLRTTEEREQSRVATREPDDVIEQMLGSRMIMSGIAKAQNAFVIEHWPRLLRELFDAAKKRDAWAWKILLDVAGVAEQLRIASGETDAGLVAELDRSLPQEIRALMRRNDAEPSHSDSPEAEP